jgi:hypothetical protein
VQRGVAVWAAALVVEPAPVPATAATSAPASSFGIDHVISCTPLVVAALRVRGARLGVVAGV